MNYGRLVLAAVVATIVDACYGFGVYGVLLAGQFARYPGVYRSNESGMAYLPLMFAGVFIAIAVAALIYSKGYEGGSGAAEGFRFGVMMGIFVLFAFGGVNYAVLNVGRRLALYAGVAGLIEWTIIGLVIGLIYKPAPSAAGRSAGV